MTLADATDYREFLRSYLLSKKERHGSSSYSFSEMSKACRVQKAYLSNVLRGKGHLNRDQLFSSCRYLDIGTFETEHLMILADFQKSTNQDRKKILKQELGVHRRQLRKTKFRVPELMEAEKSDANITLDVTSQLIRMFFTIPKFQKDPELARESLKLSRERFTRILQHLIANGVLQTVGDKVVAGKVFSHLDANDQNFPNFHLARNMKATDLLDRNGDELDYFFSVIFSSSSSTRKEIKSMLIESTKKIRETAMKGEEQEVFILTMNFAKV